MIEKARKEVEEHVRSVLNMYGVEAGEGFEGLLQVQERWMRSPEGWDGAPFGSISRRGWMQSSGTGRVFQDFGPPAVVEARESLRYLVAALHQVEPSALQMRPEKASVKRAGCRAMPLHLDRGRVGSYQIVIALGPATFLCCPGSQRRSFGSGSGYYELSKAELECVQPSEEKANPGDILLMVGGRCVHGSPAVPLGAPARIATYAHFATPE